MAYSGRLAVCILSTSICTVEGKALDAAVLCMSATFPFQSVVIIVGVVVCEISTGIFLELEKNDALVSMCVILL